MLSIASLALPSQDQDLGNPNLSARDAFGARRGEEQIGLYDEDEVRGFDLGDTVAYRVDGAFFIREFKIPDAVLEGVRVNVGINAARMLYPSPSGVVDYRLKAPSPGDREVTLTSGVRDYGSVFSEVSWSWGTTNHKERDIEQRQDDRSDLERGFRKIAEPNYLKDGPQQVLVIGEFKK